MPPVMFHAPAYLGVTGVTSLQEVRAVEGAWSEVEASTSRVLNLGVLVSRKTLRGEPTESLRYPRFTSVQALLQAAAEFSVPAVHYNSPSRGAELAGELATLLGELPEVEALQLNVPDLESSVSRFLAKTFPEIRLIQQVRPPAETAKGSAPRASSQVEPHAGVVAYALLDGSQGGGLPFLPEAMARQLGGWSEWQTLRVRPGAAGGLGPGCKRGLEQLLRLVPHDVGQGLCVDAEGGLREPVRPAREGKHQDLLDPVAVRQYLREAASTLG